VKFNDTPELPEPKAWELMGGLDFMDFHYSEVISGGASSENGIIPLLWLQFNMPVKVYSTAVILKADADFTYQGSTDYAGTTLNSDTSVQSTDKSDFLDIHLMAEIPITNDISFDGGLGYRYWKRSITQGGGYDEYYTHQLIPLGLKYYFSHMTEDSDNDYEVSLTAHYDTMINPQMRVVFSDTVISGQNSEFKLGPQNGFDVSAEIKGNVGEAWQWLVRPYWENFGYSSSGGVYNATPVVKGSGTVPLGNILEPSSNTEEFGIKLGAIYKF
jgi:hypothetical protein